MKKERQPCCVCGSKDVVALVRYTHPMCAECFHEWEELNEMPDDVDKRRAIERYAASKRKGGK